MAAADSQLSGGPAGGGAVGNESLGQSIYTYVRLYSSIYVAYKSVSIVYDGIYLISKLYTVINRHIPEYTVIYNILVYTSICKDIFSYFDIYWYTKRYLRISFHILIYSSICKDVV